VKINYLLSGKRSQFSQAALNRMELTCKGLREQGAEAEIFEIYSSLQSNKYLYYIGHLHCLLKTILFLFRSKKGDVVIIYGEHPYYFLFKWFNKAIRFFAEKHEYSSYLLYNSMTPNAKGRSKKFENSLKYFEGFITCSHELKKYYQSFTKPSCNYLVIPLLLDYKKFTGTSFTRENYIGYCGDFGNNKDGVPTLINAFYKISKKYPHLKLFLAGDISDKVVMKELNDLIVELNLKERVVFTGSIHHDRMPEFLGQASILALARPDNLQAKGGFPSKIAEYLATGRPVVVTRVGELDRYLLDRENVFFSKTDNAVDFAECLDSVLANYSFAETVGQSGRIIAKSFDYLEQTKSIYTFLK
jgi:glycosyltransferase involved in cell wall biosynthesis